MPSLSRTLSRLAIALLKHEAQKRLGDEFLSTLGDAVANFAGDSLDEQLQQFLDQGKNAEKLLTAFKSADECFEMNCGDQKLVGAIKSLPLSGLTSLEKIAAELPTTLDDSILRNLIRNQFQQNWGKLLSSGQIEHAVLVYMKCLDRALAANAEQILPSLFRIVERIEEDVKEIGSEVIELRSDTQNILANQIRSDNIVSRLGEQLSQKISEIPQVIVVEAALMSEHKAELDFGKDLIDKFQPKQAYEYLNSLKERIWDHSSNEDRYRLLTNIGSSKLLMGEPKEAANFFIEALQFNQSNAKALSNAALGYYLIDQLGISKSLANQSIQTDPSNVQAYSTSIFVSSNAESFDSILEKIPKIYQTRSEVAMALGEVAHEQGLSQEAENWLRLSIKNDERDNPDPRGFLADAMLDDIIKNNPPITFKGFVSVNQSKLNELITLYSYAWNRVSETDLRFQRYRWLANRAVAQALLGNHEDASRDIDLALNYKPEYPPFIRIKGIIAYQNKELVKAANLFRKILNNEEAPDAKFWLALIMFQDEQLTKAIELLEELLSTPDLSVEAILDFHKLLIIIMLKKGDIPKAQIKAEYIENNYRDRPDALAACSRVARLAGNNERSRELLFSSLNLLTPDSTIPERFWVIDELIENQEYDLAAKTLEGIVDINLDSPITRRYLFCLYRAGKHDIALNICKQLREQYGALDYVTDVEISIHEEIDDLTSAKSVCEEYLKVYPKNIDIQLRLAVINFRLHKYDELDMFLERSIPQKNLSYEDYDILIRLNLYRCRQKEALDLAYETRRLFFDEPKAHMTFVQVFLSIEKNTGDWLEHRIVTINSVVDVRYQKSENRLTVIIENRQDASIVREEFLPTHPISRVLLGKKIGDDVQLPDGMQTSTGIIENIRSKYVFAFQQTLEKYPTFFSQKPGIWRIQLDIPDQHTVDKEWIKPISDTIEARNTIVDEVEKYYRRRILPIGAMSQLLNENPIEIRAGLSSKPDLGIICSTGEADALNSSINLTQNAPRIVADVLSLFTINELNIGDAILEYFGKPIIARSTIEIVQNLLNDPSPTRHREHYSIGKESGQITKYYISQEIIDHNIHILENINKWTEMHCEVLPIHASLSNPKIRNEFGEKIGLSFIDSILLVQEHGSILYSDDMALRTLANNNFKVNGIWTQPLLLSLLNHGFISNQEYIQNVIRLIVSNFIYTSINPEVILESAKQADYHPGFPFLKTISILGGGYSDLNTSLNVAAKSVRLLWDQKLADQQYDSLITNILDAIVKNRKNRQRIITLFLNKLNNIGLFALAPTALDHLQRVIQDWQKLRIL